MLIKFCGPKTTRRGALGHEWSKWRGWVQEVTSADEVAELLLQPGNQFAIDEAEPLLAVTGLDPDRAGALALGGIATLEDMAGMKDKQARQLAKECNVRSSTVDKWRDAARRLLADAYPDEGEAEPESAAMAESEPEIEIDLSDLG